MSILSYAFGGSVLFNNDENNNRARRKLNAQGFGHFNATIEAHNYSIIKELRKYSQNYQEVNAKFLADIPGSQFLNTKMLVAAFHWFFGNEKPEVFTPDMYTMNNSSFAQISRISYPGEEWKRDRYLCLTEYAHVIRRNINEAAERKPVRYDGEDMEELERDYEDGMTSEYDSEMDESIGEDDFE